MKEGKEKDSIKEKKHRTRRLSIKEGIYWSFQESFGSYYLAPFAIAIGTSNPLVAIISALWNLASLIQLFTSNLIEKFKRKTLVTTSVAIQSIGWLMFAIIGYLYLNNIWSQSLPYLILINFIIILILGGIVHPAWFSWMGDVVDSKYRGRWWGKRTTILSFMTMGLGIIASIILQQFKNSNNEIQGFILFFIIAFGARIFCSFTLNKQHEPILKKKKKINYSFKEFLNSNSNFRKFVIFRGIMALVVGLTTPLFSIYFLRYLNLDYLPYMIMMLSGTFFSVITLNLWGKIADKYGNYRVIAITTIFIPITPLLYIISTSTIYLIIVPAIIGGTTWSAFMMASGNFIYDNISKEKRAKAVAYFNFFLGTGALIGGLISAYLLEVLKTTWIEPIILIFIIATILRMVVVGYWVPQLKEIKRKEKFKNLKTFQRIILKETKPTLIEDFHEIASIPNYLKEN